jgi:WD40 repeat protein
MTERAVLRGHGSEVWKVVPCPDSPLLASGGKDGTVRIWSLSQARGSLVPTRGVEFWNWPVFSEDGRFLAIGEKAEVTVRRTDDGTVVQALAEARRPIAFVSEGAELLTLGAEGDLQFWSWAGKTGRLARAIATGLTEVRAHALCSRSNLLALGDTSGNIHLWDVQRGTELRSWKAHPSRITSLAITTDGRRLASGGPENERALKLWILPEGALKTVFSGHKLGVFGVAFSRDGQLLASASVDDTCRLWNPATDEVVAVLTGHKGGRVQCRFFIG